MEGQMERVIKQLNEKRMATHPNKTMREMVQHLNPQIPSLSLINKTFLKKEESGSTPEKPYPHSAPSLETKSN